MFRIILAAVALVLFIPAGLAAPGLREPLPIHAAQPSAPPPVPYQLTFNRTLSGREYVTANVYTLAADVRGVRGLDLAVIAGVEANRAAAAPVFGLGLGYSSDFLKPLRVGVGVFVLGLQGDAPDVGAGLTLGIRF